jgi:hypothetical protein
VAWKLEQIDFQVVHACLRPPRVAVAYQRRTDWIYSARQAMSSLSRIWGGVGAIVMPLNDDGAIAEELSPMLRAYDPDHVAVHALKMADLAIEQPAIVDRLVDQFALPGEARDETWARLSKEPLLHEETWDALAVQVDGWCSPFKGLRQEARAFDLTEVGSLHRDDQPGLDLSLVTATPGEVVYTLELAGVEPLIALMVESRVGALPAGTRQGLSVVELPVLDEDLPALLRLAITGEVDGRWDLHNRYVTATGVAATPQPPSALPGDQYLAGTPFARTRRSLAEVAIGLPPLPTVCVMGDSAEDHALAVLCDRVFAHGAWVPLKLLQEDSQVGRVTRRTVHQLSWRSRVDGRPVLAVTVSQPHDVIAELVTEIEGSLGVELDINGTPARRQHLRAVPLDELTEQPARCFLADERSFDLRRSVPVRQVAGERSLLTPIPLLPVPTAVEQLGEDMAWCIDVAVPGHQLPARTAIPSAALLQHPAGSLPDSVVRAGRHGLSFSSKNLGFVPGGASPEVRLAQPLLRLPSAEQIFAALAAKQDATVERSEAGRRAATATELWGSPTAIAADLAGNTRRLLDAFLPPPGAQGDYGDGYEIRGDGYLTLRHVVRVLGVDEYEAGEVLDRLLAIKVLRRGFLLYCERCLTQAFYPIGVVGGDGFACLLCGYPSRLARGRWNKSEPEPGWNYALDQVVQDLLQKHGDIPLLAAARLARGTHSLLWAPELLVQRNGKTKELDLCLILDGEIVIGEAKFKGRLETGDRGTAKEAKRLVQAAHLLSADKIVLATANAAWLRSVTAAVEQAITTDWHIGPRPNVVELTGVGTGPPP